MKATPCGDRALILSEFDTVPSHLVARAIEAAQVPGVLEAWPSYDTVGLCIEPSLFDLANVEWAISSLESVETGPRKTHVVPVCYELGEDFAEASMALGISTSELVALHSSVAYRCHAIGFCPGFPYLGPLPVPLCGLPRRPDPRVRVPAGSVGITGNQTGIYPVERPGGWTLIGITPLIVCDWRSGFFPIEAGDLVRFEPISRNDWHRLAGKLLGDA